MFKQSSTLFLKIVLVLIAIVALVLMIWMPQNEGRNIGRDWVYIYLQDPFLAYAYIASIPFFAALYQAFKLLGLIEQNKTFTAAGVNALRNIKYCALSIIGFLVIAMVWIRVASVSSGDDPAGFMALGIVATFAASVIATAAGVFQRLLQSAVDIKSENDLTV